MRYARAPRLSGPVAGAAIGVAAGVIDSILHAFTVQFQHAAFESLPIIATSVIVCSAVGVVFQSERFGQLRWVALAFAGPGIVLLSHGATMFKQMTGWSFAGVLIGWVVVTILISIPLSFIALQETRHLVRYAIAVVLGVGLLVYWAADVRLADWILSNGKPAPGTRNVVLIFLDTVRADDALGAAPAMPHLATFAASSAWFTNAWSPASWTVPSHFAVLTGANWWRVPGDAHLGFQYQGPRLAEQFQLRGYDTAAIFANPQLSAEAGFGKGFNEFTTSRRSGVCHSSLGDLMYRVLIQGGPRLPLCSWFTASEVTGRAQRYIRRAHRPYLLAVNYLDSHDPYYVPPECRGRGFERVSKADREALLADPPSATLSRSIIVRTHNQYRAAMSCMDRSLGDLLKTAAQDPNTIIAIVGDHGEEFFDHGHGGHGFTVYRESLQVPLILRVPGIAPQQVTAPVSTTDLYACLLRAAHLYRADAPLPLFNEKKRRPVVSTYDLLLSANRGEERGYSVVAGDYHFILWKAGREVLYNYRLDPAEANPVALESVPEIAAPMRQLAVRVSRDKQRALQFSAVGYMR
jgi:arylsulfatase A-like enzyme